MKADWGDRLVAVAASLAAVACLGAVVIRIADLIEGRGATGPSSLWLDVLWRFGATTMYSPMFAWLPLLLAAGLWPWLARGPAGSFALFGVVCAIPAVFFDGSAVDVGLRLATGLIYGLLYPVLTGKELMRLFNRSPGGPAA